MGWRVNPTYDANEVWVPDSAHEDSPWSKLEVREAAEYAVDRVTIAKKFGYGYLQAPYQIPPRETTAYDANLLLAATTIPRKPSSCWPKPGTRMASRPPSSSGRGATETSPSPNSSISPR